MSRVLILGSGITGCSAALELVRQGHTVDIVESGSRVGGKVLSYCCKATDECSRCGVCVAHTAIAEALKHPQINIASGASLLSVHNTGEKISAGIVQAQPALLYYKCTGCDACLDACPEKCITKYDRGGLVQYIIDHSRCLRKKGIECSKCVEVCKASAITGNGATDILNIEVDAALIAAGHQAFNPSQKPRLGYGRLEGVITGEEAEELLSRQTYLGSPSEDVAFVQCVGSRDPQIGRNYCSCVCCSYAVRMARVLKHRSPNNQVSVYYIDLQNFDKTFTTFHRSLVDEGIEFIRSIPFSIERGNNGKLKLKIEPSEGRKSTAEHDLVVLSVGIGPAPDAVRIAELFGLERDDFGFLKSSVPNVFVSGTCAEPQGISDCMASARSVAADIIKMLPGESKPVQLKPAHGVKTKKISLCQRVLVLGGGIAGVQTAKELNSYGYATTLVESSDKIGGQMTSWKDKSIDFKKLLSGISGIKVIIEAHLLKLSGSVGSFRAQIGSPAGAGNVECGAVVVCSGAGTSGIGRALFDSDRVMIFTDLNAAMERFSRKDRPRSVGLVLDMNVEETRAGTETALVFAVGLREEYRCEVFLFCREVRVAARHLENLYDRARDIGVSIIKYEGEINLEPSENEVLISTRDSLLGEELAVACHIAGISPYGLGLAADRELVNILGIGTDSLEQMQDNNIHLFPELTNRPGIFVVGACRGRYYLPEIISDAKVAALGVHSLLSQKHLVVELTNAVVDANKCALCLTCVRICPHGAMIVDQEKRAAASLPEVCQKCGVCIGECPGSAIELPAAVPETIRAE